MQKIKTFLWFDTRAEEAAKFYVSIFKNSKVKSMTRYSAAGPGKQGSVMTVNFTLEGQEFIALNGGPHFKFNEAISLSVSCKNQKEVDELWRKLSAGGEKRECGWLQDKYGLCWQITPSMLLEAIQDKDPAKVQRVMQAMFKMTRLDIKKLKRAYEQG